MSHICWYTAGVQEDKIVKRKMEVYLSPVVFRLLFVTVVLLGMATMTARPLHAQSEVQKGCEVLSSILEYGGFYITYECCPPKGACSKPITVREPYQDAPPNSPPTGPVWECQAVWESYDFGIDWILDSSYCTPF